MPIDIKELKLTIAEWDWLINWANHRTDLLNGHQSFGTRWKMHWLLLQEWLEVSKSVCASVQRLGLDGYTIHGVSFGSDDHLRAKNQIVGHLQFNKKTTGTLKHMIFQKPICLPEP